MHTPCKESHTHLFPLHIVPPKAIAKHGRKEAHKRIGPNIVRRAVRHIRGRACQVLAEGDLGKGTLKLCLEGCVRVHQEEVRRRGLCGTGHSMQRTSVKDDHRALESGEQWGHREEGAWKVSKELLDRERPGTLY